MSILQNYENHRKLLGTRKVETIDDYIRELKKKDIEICYSDIIYKKEEFEKFEK